MPVSHAATVSPATIEDCLAVLRAGLPVIVPTDTVYGIAADSTNEAAVGRIYDAKGKDRSAPLQLLFGADIGHVRQFAVLTETAERLISAFGPAGWTIILEAAPGWRSAALAGGTTVGVRMPSAPVIGQLVEKLGSPLAASSANRHGGSSPRTCSEAIAQLGDTCGFALDDGPAAQGLDSTIIDCSTPDTRIIREGAIDRQTVARILGVDIPVLRSVRQ